MLLDEIVCIHQVGALTEASENNELFASYSNTWRGISASTVERTNSKRTGKETKNEIVHLNETSSTDGVFFDGNNTKYSLSDTDGKQLKIEACTGQVICKKYRPFKCALLLTGKCLVINLHIYVTKIHCISKYAFVKYYYKQRGLLK